MMKFIQKIINMFLGDKSNEDKSVSHDIGVLDDSPKDTVGKKIDPKAEDVNRTIVIKRTYYERGVHGVCEFPDGNTIDTLERPWHDNKPNDSCIPEGGYDVRLEPSPLVERLTNGDYTKAWTVCNVKNRWYIRFHQSNYATKEKLKGCIAMGNKAFKGKSPVVWQSRKNFDKFMELMKSNEIEQVVIVEKEGEPYKIREAPTQ